MQAFYHEGRENLRGVGKGFNILVRERGFRYTLHLIFDQKVYCICSKLYYGVSITFLYAPVAQLDRAVVS